MKNNGHNNNADSKVCVGYVVKVIKKEGASECPVLFAQTAGAAVAGCEGSNIKFGPDEVFDILDALGVKTIDTGCFLRLDLLRIGNEYTLAPNANVEIATKVEWKEAKAAIHRAIGDVSGKPADATAEAPKVPFRPSPELVAVIHGLLATVEGAEREGRTEEMVRLLRANTIDIITAGELAGEDAWKKAKAAEESKPTSTTTAVAVAAA